MNLRRNKTISKVNSPVLSALSLCRKAGKLVVGYELTAEAASKKNILVVYSSDISERTLKNVRRLAENGSSVQCLNKTMDEIEQAVGKRFGVAGVVDSGLAGLVQSKIEC